MNRELSGYATNFLHVFFFRSFSERKEWAASTFFLFLLSIFVFRPKLRRQFSCCCWSPQARQNEFLRNQSRSSAPKRSTPKGDIARSLEVVFSARTRCELHLHVMLNYELLHVSWGQLLSLNLHHFVVRSTRRKITKFDENNWKNMKTSTRSIWNVCTQTEVLSRPTAILHQDASYPDHL